MKKVIEEIFPIPEAILDGLKELARIGLIAILPVIISQLEAQRVDWKVVGVILAIAVLKSIDKMLHSYGKNTNNESLTRGITRF